MKCKSNHYPLDLCDKHGNAFKGAARDALRNNQQKAWQDLLAGPKEELAAAILKYEMTCPSQGQGKRRRDFDWAKITHKKMEACRLPCSSH